ncbi:FliM/FliN family flagellar motor switch protein [Terriglobus sp. TAA 43]|uniref:FliM/FliN family flagellar motor switch protein n=1 Tax=Terriglobus sp. TAA 43 TaxID=278961 RepID=UPI001E5DBD3A|nr:FliM/FliN family flagellar motor switch protein [Terriglobus sp. TAA 43]
MTDMYGGSNAATERELKEPTVESLLTSDGDAFLDIEMEARIQFGSREMLLSEVLELNAGDVLELDRLVSDPVDLLVGDRIVARGEVVVVGGNFALQVTEVAVPRLRLESVRCLH